MTSLRSFRAVAAALAALALPAATAGQQRTPAAEPTDRDAAGVRRALAAIGTADFAHRLEQLSHDSLAGRRTGSPGLESAAAYVAGELRALGLRPRADAGEFGGYLQRYELSYHRLDAARTSLSFAGRAGTLSATFGSDFVVMPSGRQELTGELVFAGGAGDAQPKLPAGLGGKVVAFFVAGPLDRDWYRRGQQATRAAQAAGAAATLFILDPQVGQRYFAAMRSTLEGESTRLQEVPDIALAYATAARVLAAAGLDLDTLRQETAGDVTPTATGMLATLRQPIATTTQTPPNVVAWLPGSDPALRDEFVVVSAHMDHVGTGKPDARGDSIYNGADDNASGVAAFLEVARAFGALPKAPPRSLAFVAVAGEEEGLIGSQYFVEHVPAGIGSMVADINLDMLGRNAPDLLYLVGDSISTLGDAARAQVAAHAELGFRAYSVNGGTYAASDQFSFALAGVPAIFLHTGSHTQLHTPADEIGLLDTDKITRAARLAFFLTWAVAAAEARPAFTPSGERWLAALHPYDAVCSPGKNGTGGQAGSPRL